MQIINFHKNCTIKLEEICFKIVGYMSCDSVKINHNKKKSITVNKR